MKILNQRMVQSFIENMRENERSETTIKKYCHDIKCFSDFLNGEKVSKQNVVMYKQHLINSGYAIRSINSMLAAINSIFDFLNWTDCRVKLLKVQRQAFCSEEKEISKSEYEQLCRTAEKEHKDRISLIIQSICSTGIRVSELRYITLEAVKRGKAVVSLKGKTRTIFIVNELRNRLLNYASKQKISSGAIFVSKSGKPIDRTTVWREMKKLSEDAGISPIKVFPHNLRHLFARVFYSLEKDIAKLADVLGHSNIETTRLYIVSSGAEHRRHMERMGMIVSPIKRHNYYYVDMSKKVKN